MNKNYGNVTIDNCEDEPIHIIGKIQDRGTLIAIHTENLTIDYASNNASEFFDCYEILGTSIESLDTSLQDRDDCESFIFQYVQFYLKSAEIDNSLIIKIKEIEYYMYSYISGKYLVLEFEEALDTLNPLDSSNILGDLMLNMDFNPENLSLLLKSLTDKLKDILGFDRIMLYKFHEDWHGEVISESKNSDLEPFLGLHYPATDIPKQARELYKKNLTRLISDINSEPVDVESLTDKALDLSLSQIRAVSPIHIEYMKNMGIGASFSISIVANNELWGLISCHHGSAKNLDLKKRKSLELVAHYIGGLVSSYELNKENDTVNNAKEVLFTLDNQMRNSWNIKEGLVEGSVQFTDLIQCSGGAYIEGEEVTTLGKTPNPESIKKICDWIQEKSDKNVFSTINLSSFIPEAEAYKEIASGLLSLKISKENNNYLIWFNPEQITEITWAGKDEKSVVEKEDGTFRFSPRKSFNAYAEQIRNTSKKWKKSHKKLAHKLRDQILVIKQLKANEIEKLNQKLKQAYSDLDSFSYTLSHDLKTPLNTIQGYLEIYMDESNTQDHPLLKKAFENTEIMSDMIKNILEYSKLGRGEVKKSDVKIIDLFTRIGGQMKASKDFSNLKINIPENLEVLGNEIMIYQVFLNLIENGVKYSSPDRPTEIIVSYQEDVAMHEFIVKDNGVGIETDNLGKIFDLFQRVGDDKEIDGSGIGLAIVEKIIKSHHGRIWVESTINEGTTFHVLIPKNAEKNV